MFEKLEIPIKYITYFFSWSDSKIPYPKELQNLANKLPIEYHLACKAHIEERWVDIDATWDPTLKKLGFSVNEDWNGVSNTKIAVTSLNEIVHHNAGERDSFILEELKKWTDAQNNDMTTFINAFNKWLEDERKKLQM